VVKGIIFSVLASTVFGILYFYSQFLKIFDGSQTFGWRMIALLPFLTLFMWLSGDLHLIRQVYERVKQKPTFFLLLLLTAMLAAVQLWLFLWAADAWARHAGVFGLFLIAFGVGAGGQRVLQRKAVMVSKNCRFMCFIGRGS
jgi:RarD protein